MGVQQIFWAVADGCWWLVERIWPNARRRMRTLFTNPRRQLASLLEEVQAEKVPLSQAILRAVPLAHLVGDNELESFCDSELQGWSSRDAFNLMPQYRRANGYGSLAEVQHGDNHDDLMLQMQARDGQFWHAQVPVVWPVRMIESHVTDSQKTAMATFRFTAAEAKPHAGLPADTPVFEYVEIAEFRQVLRSIGNELIMHLERASVGQTVIDQRARDR